MGLAGRIALLGVVLFGCDDPTPKADPPEPIVLPPHVPGEYPGPCLTEEGWEGEGSYRSSWRLGYDARGRITLWEQLDDDGHVFLRKERGYDDDDREVVRDELWSIRHYDGSGGDVWTLYRYAYDDNGHEVRRSEDRDRNGSIDVLRTSVWTSDGRPVEERIEQLASWVPDYLRLWTYDDDGNETRFVQEERLGDELVRHSVTKRYVDGRRVELLADTDGVLRMRVSTTYDADGRVTQAERDDDGDGVVDWRETHTYSQDGREHTAHTDADGNGDIDEVRVEVSDEGREEVRLDSNADGQVDYIAVYSQDDDGSWATYDNDGDGVVDQRRETRFRPEGGRHLEQWDDDGDGEFDLTTTWQYGPHGLDEERTVDASGAVVDYVRMEYDRVGNRLIRRSPTYNARYHYICPWSPFER